MINRHVQNYLLLIQHKTEIIIRRFIRTNMCELNKYILYSIITSNVIAFNDEL